MKIRTSFVSNSSSSSFVILFKKTLFDKLPEDLQEFVLSDFGVDKVMGADCYVYGATVYDAGGDNEWAIYEWLKENAQESEYYLDRFDDC